MSRKEPSFAGLIDYMTDIEKSDTKFHIYHNLFTRNDEQVKSTFQDNAQFVQKRKNANYMYHEILSITKSKKLGIEEQKEALRQIAYEYAHMRASKNLVFGCVHNDHDDHLHYHLLISANEAGQSKKTRLSKAEFSQIKKQIEQNVLSRYPELEQKVVMSKEASWNSEKFSRKAGEQKRRTGKLPQRDALKARLSNILKDVQSKEAFFASLSEAHLKLYVLGKTVGVRDLQNDRPHRFKTLGLWDEFESCSQRINLTRAELDEMKKSSSAKSKRGRKSSETEEQKKAKTGAKTSQSTTAQSENGQTQSAKSQTTQKEQREQKQDMKDAQTSKETKVIQERVQRKIEMEQLRGKQSQSQSQDSSSHTKK